MTDNQSKLTNVTHIPPFMLKLIAGNLLVWLCIIPAVMLVQQLRLNLLYLPVAAVLIIPVVIMTLFLMRVLIWVYFAFFWYLMGFGAVLGLSMGGVALVMMVLSPDIGRVTPYESVISIFPTVPAGITNNLILLVLFILAVFGLYSLVKRVIPNRERVEGIS